MDLEMAYAREDHEELLSRVWWKMGVVRQLANRAFNEGTYAQACNLAIAADRLRAKYHELNDSQSTYF